MRTTTIKQAKAILAGVIHAPEIETVTRRQDDTDGSTEPIHEITVSIGPDGDMYIGQGFNRWLRFRNFIGGGMSLHTHNALRLMAIAIQMDNEERPQRARTESAEPNAREGGTTQ